MTAQENQTVTAAADSLFDASINGHSNSRCLLKPIV